MEINFLDAGCGDAICIRYFGTDSIYHNIIIDGGTERGNVYELTLKKTLEQIVLNKELIDLWIITHIDDDHIGGILRLIKDESLLKQVDLSRTVFWYNYSIWDYDTGLREDKLKNVKQGIRLREYIQQHAILANAITNSCTPFELWGATITILSPDARHYEDLLTKWKTEEHKIRQREHSSLKRATKNDYQTAIGDFDLESEVVDGSLENASSIAFLLEYRGKKALFTADSHAAVLEHALAKITGGNKLKLELMQVPHHGSRYNSSKTLFALVDCGHYVFTADGLNKSNLPNKATMAKILAQNAGKDIHFYITQRNDLTQNIFKIDGDCGVNLHFPASGDNGLRFAI